MFYKLDALRFHKITAVQSNTQYYDTNNTIYSWQLLEQNGWHMYQQQTDLQLADDWLCQLQARKEC